VTECTNCYQLVALPTEFVKFVAELDVQRFHPRTSRPAPGRLRRDNISCSIPRKGGLQQRLVPGTFSITIVVRPGCAWLLCRLSVPACCHVMCATVTLRATPTETRCALLDRLLYDHMRRPSALERSLGNGRAGASVWMGAGGLLVLSMRVQPFKLKGSRSVEGCTPVLYYR
jgi:hypothetical protein